MSVIENPLTISDMSSNVTNVLKFMAERKVKMHQINSKGKLVFGKFLLFHFEVFCSKSFNTIHQ